ncbi:MAG: tetratricopeptide repeat protein [bacterium]
MTIRIRSFLPLLLAVWAACLPAAHAQEQPAALEQSVRELCLAWELPHSTAEEDLKRYSDSSLDPLNELREALLLSRLPRYADPGKRADYLNSQFLPFLQRQSAELQATAEARYLQALALRGLGKQAEAREIAAAIVSDPAEQGDGYALWAAVLLDQNESTEAAKVLRAGSQFYRDNPLLEYEQARLLLADARAADALSMIWGMDDRAAAAGYSQSALLGILRLKGRIAAAAGEHDTALLCARQLLESFPGDGQMLQLAAGSSAERRQYNLAAEYQERLCAVSGSSANWLALARYRAELNDPQAGEAFAQALAAATDNASEVLLARSAWLERGGEREAAIADLRRLLETDPDNREAARSLARMLAGSAPGPQGEGEEALRTVIATDPSPAAYLDLLEIVGDDPRRRQEYDNLYNDMLARFRNQPTVVLFDAQRLLEQEKYAPALQRFRDGEGLDPLEAGFALGIADCLRGMGGYTEAIDAYQRALRLEWSPRAVAGMARAQERSGQPEAAERTFRDNLNSHPRDAALVMEYGLFLFEGTQYTAALEQYGIGRQLEPDNEVFVNRSALCLFQLNQIPEAIALLKEAIAIRPRPLFYRNLAIAYEEDAEVELAERWYRDGLELFPGDQQLLEGYSEFLEQQGRGQEALEMLAQSAQQSTDTEVLMDLATLAQSAGRMDLARRSYARALELDPFDLVINERYSTFLAIQSDNDGLRAHLLDALDLLAPEDFDELIGTLTGFWVEQRLTADGELLLSQLIDADPTVVRLYNSLGLMQHLAGDNETALTTVTRGQRYAGESFLGLYLQTLITWRSIGVNEALPLGARLIELPEADAKAWLLYLDMLASAREHQEEAAVAARGLKQFFGNVPLYQHLVRATREQGEIRELIRVLEDPQYVRIALEERPLLLGRSYVAVGNYVRALASLQPLLEQNPFDEEALRLSGEANFMIGEQALAREQLTSALALNPELASASIWLGWVLLEDRDLAGAEQSFSVAEKSPALDQLELAWTRLGQATVAIRRGERMQAQSLLTQAEALGGGDERFDSYLPRIRDEIRPQ